MTTLYRTPNIIVDSFEWHAIVRLKDGRASVAFRFRPLSTEAYHWLNATSWSGKKPKGLGEFFAPYRRHIAFALESETRRREATQPRDIAA